MLLLSVLHEVEAGRIRDGRVYITAELVSTFKDYWRQLVDTANTANFSLPFYHLSKEKRGYWRLVEQPGMRVALTTSHSIRSFANLLDTVAYVQLEPELALLMQDSAAREVLRLTLLEAYFPQKTLNGTTTYLTQLAHHMAADDPVAYRTQFEALARDLDPITYEEEVFVRSGVFKREVPKLYGYACCVSGLRVEATADVQLVDACHIVPFRETHDDTLTNGLTLTPTLHRAFDRGLFWIDDAYRVRLAAGFREIGESPYSIRQFEGLQIRLPDSTSHWPSLENLRWRQPS